MVARSTCDSGSVDPNEWRFVCPVCKHEASVSEYRAAGAPDSAIAFSCIGRWADGVGCDYAGGGLFRLNPVHIDGSEDRMFDFGAPARSGGTSAG